MKRIIKFSLAILIFLQEPIMIQSKPSAFKHLVYETAGCFAFAYSIGVLIDKMKQNGTRFNHTFLLYNKKLERNATVTLSNDSYDNFQQVYQQMKSDFFIRSYNEEVKKRISQINLDHNGRITNSLALSLGIIYHCLIPARLIIIGLSNYKNWNLNELIESESYYTRLKKLHKSSTFYNKFGFKTTIEDKTIEKILTQIALQITQIKKNIEYWDTKELFLRKLTYYTFGSAGLLIALISARNAYIMATKYKIKAIDTDAAFDARNQDLKALLDKKYRNPNTINQNNLDFSKEQLKLDIPFFVFPDKQESRYTYDDIFNKP